MRRGDYHHAAASFARAVAVDPDGSLAEDGAFWYGVALARDRRPAEAIEALRTFTADHPRSTRAGEASAMLGHLLLARGDIDEAKRRFEAAASDPSPAVQRSAREGLDALVRAP